MVALYESAQTICFGWTLLARNPSARLNDSLHLNWSSLNPTLGTSSHPPITTVFTSSWPGQALTLVNHSMAGVGQEGLWKLRMKSQSRVLCQRFAGFRWAVLTLKLIAGPDIFLVISFQDKNLCVIAKIDKLNNDWQLGFSSFGLILKSSCFSFDKIKSIM